MGILRNKKTCILLVTLLGLVLVFSAVASPQGTRTLFFVDVNRDQASLEADAGLIADCVQRAKSGDFIEALTLDGQAIFSCNLNKKLNSLEARREKNVSLNSLKQFYISQINSPRKSETTNIAGALTRGMGRFNAEGPKQRYLLIFLSSGLEKDRSVDFSKGYPSDSWISHQASPFSRSPRNQTGSKVEVLFAYQSKDFANTLHTQKIERFYSILVQSRNAELTGFSEDHQTISNLTRNGPKIPRQVPKPENDNGKLIFYTMDGKVQYIEKSDSEPTSMMAPGRPLSFPARHVQSESVACSVLMYRVDKGTATMWVSLRGPHGNALQGLRPDSLRVLENINGTIKPARDVRILSNSDRLPASIVLVRDISPSQGKSELAISENALKSFLDQMLPQDKVGLVSFSSHSTVKKLTDNKGSIKKSMKIPLIRVSTAFYDALDTAIGMLVGSPNGTLNCIIAFSDGEDNSSKKTSTDIIRSARQAGSNTYLHHRRWQRQ